MSHHISIVAESGCTHEGDLGKLFALAEMCADAGVDGFKTQWCSDPEELCRRRNAAEYLPAYQWLRFPLSWHEQIAERCHALGLSYSSTAYLPQDVAAIDPYIDWYKIAAFETGAIDLVEAVVQRMRSNDKPLIMSLGLGADVPSAVVGDDDDDDEIVMRTKFLRCVSAYPTPIAELNLALIAANDPIDGLSDHTAASDRDSLLVGAFAVAAGATWIERHVRLESCSPSNPDYTVSLSAHQLTEYVRLVRLAESALGSSKATGPMPSETPMLKHVVRVDAAEDGD